MARKTGCVNRLVQGSRCYVAGAPDCAVAAFFWPSAPRRGRSRLAGQALVRGDGGAGHRAVSRLVCERLPGLLAFPVQLRVGQAEPGSARRLP